MTRPGPSPGPVPETLAARPGRPLRGRVRAPGDKSISHRALILGALARGETLITGLLESADVLATARAVAAFGAAVERLEAGRWRVRGAPVWRAPAETVDCGNSGTAARLLLGAAAGHPLSARFDGDASLRSRPMGRVAAPLRAMGATLDGERLPLTLRGGGLTGVDWTSPVASAQVKSAVLLAGLNADGETVVREPVASRDHTERMLRAFGATLEVVGTAARLAGGQALAGTAVEAPGDPSSAAFPLVAALLVPGSEVTVEGVLLNPLRTGLYDTLLEMGADLEVTNRRALGGEPVGDLTARHSQLKGVAVPAARAPAMIDEYPILAVAAAFAEGETRLQGLAELRVKESDRVALTAALLTACGAEVAEAPEGLTIRGRAGRRPAGGARVTTHGDHRIAMSALVLGLAAAAPVACDGPEMIATSFPGFAALMAALGADIG